MDTATVVKRGKLALLNPYTKIIVVILLFAVPLVIHNAFYLDAVNMVFYFIILAVALDLQMGFLGVYNFGIVGFVAIGAYTVGILTVGVWPQWWGFWVALLIGAVFAGIVGVLLGLSTFRIRGDYFCIVSLGFGEIIRYVLLNWVSLTGGPMGITGVPAPRIFSLALASRGQLYWFVLILVLIVLVLTVRMKNSYLGRAWVAIREDEVAAEASGINMVQYQAINMAMAAVIAAVAGGFFAGYLNYLNPESFVSNVSLNIVCMVILGGAGSIWGAVMGAGILTLIPEIVRPLAQYSSLLYGLLMFLVMIFRPKGVLGK